MAKQDEEDRFLAASALAHVLSQITRLMAPFAPFFSEYIWDKLKPLVNLYCPLFFYVCLFYCLEP